MYGTCQGLDSVAFVLFAMYWLVYEVLYMVRFKYCCAVEMVDQYHAADDKTVSNELLNLLSQKSLLIKNAVLFIMWRDSPQIIIPHSTDVL